jgi:hypothetical protein
MKVKMKDLGTSGIKSPTLAAENSKPKKRYPSVTLSADKLPELEDIKFGKKVTLMFDAEVTGMRTSEGYDDTPKGTQMVTLDLKSGCCYAEGKKSKDATGKSMDEATHEAAEEMDEHASVQKLRGKMKAY